MENEIVISQDMAEKLFLTSNVVGYMVQIDDKSYQICGIYKEDKSIMAQSFGNSRLFIPLKAAKPLVLPLDMMTGNIFDLTAYYEILAEKIAKPNTLISPQSAYYLRYSQIAITLYAFAILFIPIVLFILIPYSIKKVDKFHL